MTVQDRSKIRFSLFHEACSGTVSETAQLRERKKVGRRPRLVAQFHKCLPRLSRGELSENLDIASEVGDIAVASLLCKGIQYVLFWIVVCVCVLLFEWFQHVRTKS